MEWIKPIALYLFRNKIEQKNLKQMRGVTIGKEKGNNSYTTLVMCRGKIKC